MARAQTILPILTVTAGICTFSMMDAVMKSASIQAGVYNALLLRCLAAIVLMLPVWLLGGGAVPRGAVLRVHALRSAVVAVMAPLFFWGLVRMPIAEAIALSFIAPLIALYLAAVLLGEQIQPRAILASLLGLAGVLVIGAGRFGEGAMTRDAALGIAAVLASAVFYAWNLVLQRQQAQLSNPVEVALFQNLFVSMIFLTAAPWLAEWPSTPALGTIGIAALLAVVSLMLLSWGYARAEAQVLLPIEYTGFIWAALFGWLLFGEAVTWTTVAGVVLIVIGCWIAARAPTEMTAL